MLKKLVKFPILKRLIPSILKALKIRDKKFKSDGINYLLDLRYLVDRRFYLFGWDDDIIDYLDKFIKDNKCKFFLDIGSCWGVYSLRIAKKNSNVNIWYAHNGVSGEPMGSPGKRIGVEDRRPPGKRTGVNRFI